MEKLNKIVYWVGMDSDTIEYCKSCDDCMRAKQPLPANSTLVNSPIGKQWERIAVDVIFGYASLLRGQRRTMGRFSLFDALLAYTSYHSSIQTTPYVNVWERTWIFSRMG